MNKPFPAYLKPSGWNALLPPRLPATSVPGERSFDYAVIGAGYTGLAAARRLAEQFPNRQILLLEGDVIGEGPSARNSGLVINLPHNTKVDGGPEKRASFQRQIRLYDSGLAWLEGIVKDNRIDCSWSPAGKFYGAVTADGEKSLRTSLEQYREWGIPFTEFDRGGLQEALGTSYYHYGFHSFSSVFVQPAALVRGLADSLPKNVTLIEQTPVHNISDKSPFRLDTARGQFVANKVILANNAFAKSLGFLRDRLITMYVYAAMSRQLDPDQLAQTGRLAEWGVVPAKRIGSTVRKTIDGRILVRCGLTYEGESARPAVLEVLSETYRRRFPELAKHGFEHVWAGAVGLTSNGSPYFGELRPGLYGYIGCNGVGILKGSMFGRLLAELAMGIDSESLRDVLALERPSWLPPDPFRKLGVISAISYQTMVAGAER